MPSASPAHLLQYRGPQEPPKTHAFPEWDEWYDQKKVRFLREQTEIYAADPKMRDLAVRILRNAGVAERDYPAMCAALLRFVQDKIYYVEEKDEQLFSPWRTLQMGYGDCDDAALLLASLAGSINLRCRYVLAGKAGKTALRWVEGTRFPAGQRPVFGHIYCEFQWPFINPKWAASAEPIMKGAPLGYDFVLHGAVVDAHGRPSLDWRVLHKAQETGLRSIGTGPARPSAFGALGDAVPDVDTTPGSPGLIRRLTGAGLMGRIGEEVAVVIPITIVSVIAAYAAENWLLPQLLKLVKGKKK